MTTYQGESFYRANTRQSLDDTTLPPFNYKVSKIPTLTSGLLTVSPNTVNEEIVEYSGVDGSNLYVTVIKRGIKPSSQALTTNGSGAASGDYNNSDYMKPHPQADAIQADVTHLHVTGFAGISENNTFTGNNVFSKSLRLPVYADATARDAAITSPENGMMVYNTALGIIQQYIGATWTDMASGTTSNASTTVAGKVEVATSAESIAGTNTGGTGAPLVATPSDIAKNTQSATFVYGADAGGDDAYVVALTPTLAAYTTGQTLTMKVTTPNTGACTVDFGPGAKSIKMRDGSDPISGAVSGIVQLTYDGTNFILMSPMQDNLAISTKAEQSYYTHQIPMIATSGGAVAGWTLTTTNVTFEAGGHIVFSPSGGAAMLQTTGLPGSGTTSSYSPTLGKEIRVLSRWRALSLSTDRAGFGITAGVSPYELQSDVNIAVRFVNNGGVLYAHTANGTAATSTNVTGALTLANFNTYEIVFTPGVSATFYVNGTLVATHTTNLPTTGTLTLQYGTSSNGRVMHLYPPIVSIQQ